MRKISYPVAEPIVQVSHQPALLYVENLIESTGNMKAQSIHIVVLHIPGDLLPCKPTLVAECEFKFVPVLAYLFRT